MKKAILCIILILSTLLCTACISVVKKKNVPDADRKSDTATMKENVQDTVIEMED